MIFNILDFIVHAVWDVCKQRVFHSSCAELASAWKLFFSCEFTVEWFVEWFLACGKVQSLWTAKKLLGERGREAQVSLH